MSPKNCSRIHSSGPEPIIRSCGFQRPGSASASMISPASKPWRVASYSCWRSISTSQVPEDRIASSGRAPEPTAANCVSWPAATTGMPSGRPVRSAASAVTAPITPPGSTQRGKKLASRPARLRTSADQSRAAMSIAIIVPAAVGSMDCSPHSSMLSSPGIISQRSARSRGSGAFSRSQMSLSSVSKGMTW